MVLKENLQKHLDNSIGVKSTISRVVKEKTYLAPYQDDDHDSFITSEDENDTKDVHKLVFNKLQNVFKDKFTKKVRSKSILRKSNHPIIEPLK